MTGRLSTESLLMSEKDTHTAVGIQLLHNLANDLADGLDGLDVILGLLESLFQVFQGESDW